MLVFDLTNQDSFLQISKWLENIKENADENISIVLLGNKYDLKELI